MPSGTGEEEELLQEMIDERDKKIRQLTVQFDRLNDKIARKRSALQHTLVDASDQRVALANQAMGYNQRTLNARQGIETILTQHILPTSIQQSSSSLLSTLSSSSNHSSSSATSMRDLYKYTDVLKENSSPEALKDSTPYITRMQSQLCKAMHSMGILEHQLEILKDWSNETVKYFKEAMNTIVNDKSTNEVALMNDLMKMDSSKRDMEDHYKKQLKVEFKSTSKNNQQNGQHNQDQEDNDDEDDDEDEEEENDEEEDGEDDDSEEIDEDLLREIVMERQEDVENLQQENERQVQRIEELQSAIAILKQELGTNQ